MFGTARMLARQLELDRRGHEQERARWDEERTALIARHEAQLRQLLDRIMYLSGKTWQGPPAPDGPSMADQEVPVDPFVSADPSPLEAQLRYSELEEYRRRVAAGNGG